MIRTVIISLILTLSFNSIAKETKIITTIRPLQSIIANITDGANDIGLIIDYNQSIHNFYLRPNTIKEIHHSHIVIFISKDFELFMGKIIDALYNDQKILEVSKIAGLNLLLNDPNEEKHNHDEHCDHRGYQYDYHFWLDVDKVKIVANGITEFLSKELPENAQLYKDNLAKFIAKLSSLDKNIKEKIKPAIGKNYIVTHDAYNYFINRYGLNKPMSMSFNHTYYIGGRDFLNLQRAVRDNTVQCIFEEPQFESYVTRKIMGDNKTIRIGKLDAEWGPENASIKEAYFAMMESIADSFNECFK